MDAVRAQPAEGGPGELVRQARRKQGLTLVQLGELTGYSAAQVSRYERGVSPLTDVTVLRRFADALGIPSQALGLTAPPEARHGRVIGPSAAYPRLPRPRVAETARRGDGEDPVRRRKLLVNLAVTAAAAAGAPILPTGKTPGEDAAVGEVLVARVRDAMLGLHADVTVPSSAVLRTDLARAFTDFHACAYDSLAVRLPRLICAAHARAGGEGAEDDGLLAQSYLLATRMLIKLDEQQLGWMAADRARQAAEAAGVPLLIAEAARQLAVLARKADWHEQALSIALAAADRLALRGGEPTLAAQRGLLIQSAAYTAAKTGDAAGMRELTGEAAAIARELGPAAVLRNHGGGFSPATVQLHLVSAENSAGDPSAALTAARAVAPGNLPSIERRARYYTDIATAFARSGRRDDCIRALLAAEHHAPEETHARPAVKSLVSGLLVSGRTTTELRALAARVGVLT
ncbi:helix-turn-helix domain-containing protein [Streptomyces sp. NRRL B-1677]|uniref:XRE family transcriptional regulator n=1 Tax=Streptomyces klenkii TaxID=1420899 RepID=A0A3B0AL69_9ACTN|nr:MULTISPECIES: helix-turn-helix transcriptional regulator [Streptomyces]MBF6050288.1 helix-turn-helix domain-containing protein [Streptomyces sp. NRRL B-1677]RKN61360.1 XRE family transcriptional regulator [Streptomyces klenkii]